MSFILEALKRADRERKLERAPDLSAVYEESNLRRHNRLRSWLWLIGLLLVVAIVVGLMLWSKGPDPLRSPAPEGASASRPSSSSETTDKENTSPPSFAGESGSLEAKRSSREISGSKAIQRLLQKAKPDGPVRSVTKKTARAKTVSKPVEKAPEPKPVPTAVEMSDLGPDPVTAGGKREPVQRSPSASLRPEKASMEPVTPNRRKTVEAPAKAVAAHPAEPPPAPGAKEQVGRKRIETIPLIAELPYDTQEKLGKLQINVHSYSENPAERMVFINMHRYKVGDKIGEGGPLLKEITPDGVIIDYGEGRARLQVR